MYSLNSKTNMCWIILKTCMYGLNKGKTIACIFIIQVKKYNILNIMCPQKITSPSPTLPGNYCPAFCCSHSSLFDYIFKQYIVGLPLLDLLKMDHCMYSFVNLPYILFLLFKSVTLWFLSLGWKKWKKNIEICVHGEKKLGI